MRRRKFSRSWILEPINHPDNLKKLPEIIEELQQRGGEDWAAGEALKRVYQTLRYNE